MDELSGQMADLKKLASEGHPICFLGDYNCSFADNYYPTKDGKSVILDCFAESGLKLLTEDRLECIDHIAVSESFISGATVAVEECNCDKELSDHKGIVVIFK